MTSFNTYVNSIELVKANARILYGRDLTYDVVVATKDKVQHVYLMGYEANGEGVVLFTAHKITADDEGTPEVDQLSLITRINKELKAMLGRAMDGMSVGTKIPGELQMDTE